jgi:Predicted nucleic-acid-binding protein implicated in transcription termination
VNKDRMVREKVEGGSAHVPLRTCVLCRRKLPKRELARHVRDGSGQLICDPAQVLPGRGIYVCSDEACRKRFEKFGLRKHPKGGKQWRKPTE